MPQQMCLLSKLYSMLACNSSHMWQLWGVPLHGSSPYCPLHLYRIHGPITDRPELVSESWHWNSSMCYEGTPARPLPILMRNETAICSPPLHALSSVLNTSNCFSIPQAVLSGFRSGTLKLSRTIRISDSNFFHCRGLLEATRMKTRLPTAVAATNRWGLTSHR